MRLPRFRIRTLMIAVAIAGAECATAAYVLSLYFQRLGPNPITIDGWIWVLQIVLILNVVVAPPIALILWHLWRFTIRLFRACDAAFDQRAVHREFHTR